MEEDVGYDANSNTGGGVHAGCRSGRDSGSEGNQSSDLQAERFAKTADRPSGSATERSEAVSGRQLINGHICRR
ncbi:MAG TPA: hypothetical protein VK862_13240 [Afifellaceae bacterium]|nr:hypothetical protein [Afifellaceae bacterium]